MARVFCIGDIHGCFEQLLEMFTIINDRYTPGQDKIVFLGDYVDRGPDSKKVVQTMIELQQANKDIICLYGNHEDMFLDIIEAGHPSSTMFYYQQYGQNTVLSYTTELPEDQIIDGFVSAVPLEHIKWMQNLPTMTQFGRYVFVHAGIDPTIPLSLQSKNIRIWDRNSVGYDGDYLGGHFVVFGHTPQSKPLIKRNQLGIDTGCCFGGALTCAEIDIDLDDPSQIIFHTVQNKENSNG